jgi:acetoin utilization protein AcuC
MFRPLFIGSEIYRRSRYGGRHPLAIPRVSAAIDLCRALGWLPDEVYIDSPTADVEQLARFHDRGYIEAVIRAEAEQAVDDQTARRYNIGRNGNPVFGEVFRRPATACGASLKAAELLREGGIVYSPAGGTHHGRPDRASGFCYFNDPALAILALLDQGLERVLYVDVDAHHGDGVEAAFAGERRVLTVSVHQEDLWPRTGRVEDRGGGSARNLPVPAGLNDTELAWLVEQTILPLGRAFAPQALVLQGGADALSDDPLSGGRLSNRALWAAVASLKGLAPRLLVTGGGGYNPWSVARAWSGVWATLNGFAIPDRLPPAAEAVLRGLFWNRRSDDALPERWFTALADPRNPGPVRERIKEVAAAALA